MKGAEATRCGERENGKVEKKEIKKSVVWVPRLVVGIESRYRE